MSGILLLLAYGVFWWICWMVSGVALALNFRLRMIARIIVFFLLAASPYYYYLFQKKIYDQTCEKTPTFFSHEKVDISGSFFVYTYSMGEFLSRGHQESFMTYIYPKSRPAWTHEYVEGILTSGGTHDDFEALKFDTSNRAKSALTLEYKSHLFDAIRYGYFIVNKEYLNGTNLTSQYIYDFKEKRKISNVSSLSFKSFDSNTFGSYLIPVAFNHCDYADKNGLSIMARTFNNWED